MALVQVQYVTMPDHIYGGFVISYQLYCIYGQYFGRVFALFWPNWHVLADFVMYLSLPVLNCMVVKDKETTRVQ